MPLPKPSLGKFCYTAYQSRTGHMQCTSCPCHPMPGQVMVHGLLLRLQMTPTIPAPIDEVMIRSRGPGWQPDGVNAVSGNHAQLDGALLKCAELLHAVAWLRHPKLLVYPWNLLSRYSTYSLNNIYVVGRGLEEGDEDGDIVRLSMAYIRHPPLLLFCCTEP